MHAYAKRLAVPVFTTKKHIQISIRIPWLFHIQLFIHFRLQKNCSLNIYKPKFSMLLTDFLVNFISSFLNILSSNIFLSVFLMIFFFVPQIQHWSRNIHNPSILVGGISRTGGIYFIKQHKVFYMFNHSFLISYFIFCISR